ncbi:MAG: O-antigen ligase domain-containing protein, partial [Chloroflexi bacterium]
HFAGAFAQRYQNQIRFYQIWDEPNIAPHWGNRLVEPVAYGHLLAETAPAIRAADADAVILLAALAPTADRGHTAIDEGWYLRRLYAAGAAPYFDAVAAQPFGFGLPPDDSRSRVEILNFQRIGLLRRVMVAAGDGEKPIWAVRYGWNRSTNSIWQTVTTQTQSRYVTQANALAQHWPWLAGLGWAVERPARPADDPLWGFALYSPAGEPTALLETFARVNRAASFPLPESRSTRLFDGLFWFAALLWILWRGWRSGQVAGLSGWSARFAAQPAWTQIAGWLLLAAVYYFAAWPPLIALCWLAASLILAAQPLTGLLLAAFFLPFQFQHKELALVGTVLAMPPAHALLMCSLPGLWRRWTVTRQRWRFAPRHTDWLALGWLGIGLLSASAGWQWAVTPAALWQFTIAPLLLYALARTSAVTPHQRLRVTSALAAGCVAAALIGLWLWGSGQGVVVDGVRRLLGLTFSPNQTALMLVRGLFVCLALGAANQGGTTNRGAWRWLWVAGAGVIGVALLLTGSRGALLLGIPGGLALWLALQPAACRRLAGRGGLIPGLILLVSAGLALALGERLLNSGTISQRLHIWRGAWDLWRAYPWLGVGPGGFFWHYPAFMTAAASTEPNLLHPHNIWLEFATDWGVPGLLWLIGFGYWLVLRIKIRAGRLNGLEVGLLAGLVAGIAHGQVDAFGALPELVLWNWLVIGLLRK